MSLVRVNNKNGATELSYKSHRTVDDASGVITAVTSTTGDAPDGQQLPTLLAQHEQNTGEHPQIIVGDKHYGTAENYRHCQPLNIVTHLKAASPAPIQGKPSEPELAFSPLMRIVSVMSTMRR